MSTAPPTLESLDKCIQSAKFWVRKLPEEVHKTARTMRIFSALAVLVSAITSVGVWPLIAHSSELWAQSLTSAVAFCAAILAGIPNAIGLRGRHDAMISLSQRYGRMYGDLLDAKYLSQIGKMDFDAVHKVVERFDDLRAEKEALGLGPSPEEGAAAH